MFCSAGLGWKTQTPLIKFPWKPRQSALLDRVSGTPSTSACQDYPQDLPLTVDLCAPVLALVTFKWSQGSAYNVLGIKKLKNASSVPAESPRGRKGQHCTTRSLTLRRHCYHPT